VRRSAATAASGGGAARAGRAASVQGARVAGERRLVGVGVGGRLAARGLSLLEEEVAHKFLHNSRLKCCFRGRLAALLEEDRLYQLFYVVIQKDLESFWCNL
jgi:hypothetical protein